LTNKEKPERQSGKTPLRKLCFGREFAAFDKKKILKTAEDRQNSKT